MLAGINISNIFILFHTHKNIETGDRSWININYFILINYFLHMDNDTNFYDTKFIRLVAFLILSEARDEPSREVEVRSDRSNGHDRRIAPDL